jgi:hypothetical protein
VDRRLGGPQSRSEHGGEEKNSQPLPGLEPPIIQTVVQRYTTEQTSITYNHTLSYSSLYIIDPSLFEVITASLMK